MTDHTLTETDYARLVQAVGPARAKQYLSDGMQIVPAEVEFKPVVGGLGVGGSNVDEEDTSEGGALNTVVYDTTDDTDASIGALPAATTNDLRAKIAKYADLGKQKQAFYEKVAERLAAQRMSPSMSEQLFQLSAALAQPTTVRGFSGVMANVMPVLQKQEEARRLGEIKRQDALDALTAQQLAGQSDLLKQEINAELSLAKLNAAAGKLPAVVSGPNGPLEPQTGEPVKKPVPQAFTDLEANPTEENLNSMVEEYPRFRKEFIAAYQRGLLKRGVIK